MNQIKHRHTDAVLYEYESRFTIREALEKATQSGANLRGALLSGANLRDARLSGADLSGADMRGARLLDADMRGARLTGADLLDADMRGARLTGADLLDADMRGARLTGALLSGALLSGADLLDADMRDARLSGADMRGADMRGARLTGALLSGADLGETLGKLIGNRPLFQCGPIGSRSDYLMAFITDKGIAVKAGCFSGMLDEFRAAVEKTHGDNDHGKEYAMAILMIETHAAIWTPKENTK
jgi:hypothetical protein